MIQKKDWKIGNVYSYARAVEPLATETHEYVEYNMEDPVHIGKGFVCVSDEKDNTLSFVIANWDAWNGVGMRLIFKG